MAQVLEGNEIRFPQGWIRDEATGVVALHKGDVGPSYAVREISSEQGSKLELLTRQTDQTTGEVNWMPAKTPCLDYPEKVIQEAEYRQQRIGKSWSLDGSLNVLVHKDGKFGARLLDDGSGRLELLTMRKDLNGDPQGVPAKTPYTGSPEQVFREAGRRQTIMNAINEGKMLPPGWTIPCDREGIPVRDQDGKKIAVHPEKVFAVRSAGDGKLELLTAQLDKTAHKWSWKPAVKGPLIATPEKMYAEIGRRQYGINMDKQSQVGKAKPVEKAQQQTKAQSKARTPDKGKERER